MERGTTSPGLPRRQPQQQPAAMTAAADDRASLLRSQELDRALFPSSGPGNIYGSQIYGDEYVGGGGSTGGGFPPIRNPPGREAASPNLNSCTAQQEQQDAEARWERVRGPEASSSRRANGSPAPTSCTNQSRRMQRRGNAHGIKANAPPPRSYGTNPFNPFEGVVDATPALRYGARDWHQLELLLPSGMARQDIQESESDLAAFLQNSLAINAPRQLPSSAPATAPHTSTTYVSSGNSAGGGSAPAAFPPATATGPPTLPSPWPSPVKGSPQSRLNTAASPTLVTDSDGGMWAQQRLPPPISTGNGASTAPLCQLSHVLAGHGGEAAATAVGRCTAPPSIGGEDVSLVTFISERHSARRHAQVASDWLDLAVARAGQQYSPEVLLQPDTCASPTGAAFCTTPGSPSPTKRGPPLPGQQPPRQQSPPCPRSPSRLMSPPRLAPPFKQTARGFSTDGGPAAWDSWAGGVQASRLEDFVAAADLSNSKRMMQEGATRSGLAARFAAAAARGSGGGSPGGLDASAVISSPGLWLALMTAVEACASNMVAHIAHGCFEDGAMLARLWNLHTALLDMGAAQLRQENAGLVEEAQALRRHVKRLHPLIQWGEEARCEITGITCKLEAANASLLLAARERDGLLRENDKIILYYKRELRRFKREQKKSAWRLAKKLKNTQDQLQLMQRDRDQLVGAVAYSRKEAGRMVAMVEGVHVTFTTMAKTLDLEDELMEDLHTIDRGLRHMQGGVNKVEEVNMEAEDQHFVCEEEVTKVAADDDTNDDLLDQVLADGDPDETPDTNDPDPEIDGLIPRSPTISASSSPPGSPCGGTTPRGDTVISPPPGSRRKGSLGQGGAREGRSSGGGPAWSADWDAGSDNSGEGDQDDKSVAGQDGTPAARSRLSYGGLTKDGRTHRRQRRSKPSAALERVGTEDGRDTRQGSGDGARSTRSRNSVQRSVTNTPSGGGQGGDEGGADAPSVGSGNEGGGSAAGNAGSGGAGGHERAASRQGRDPRVQTAVQTDNTGNPEAAMVARNTAALEALQEQNSASVSYALVSLGLDPAIASTANDPMDGLVEGVKQRIAELQRQVDARTGQQQQAETRLDAAADRLAQRTREALQAANDVQRAEAKAAEAVARHTALCEQLTAIGLDPEAPALPHLATASTGPALPSVLLSPRHGISFVHGEDDGGTIGSGRYDETGNLTSEGEELEDGEEQDARKGRKGARTKGARGPHPPGGVAGGNSRKQSMNGVPSRRPPVSSTPPPGAKSTSRAVRDGVSTNGGTGGRGAPAMADAVGGMRPTRLNMSMDGGDGGSLGVSDHPTLGAGGGGGGCYGGGGGGAASGINAASSPGPTPGKGFGGGGVANLRAAAKMSTKEDMARLQVQLRGLGHVEGSVSDYVASPYKRAEQLTGIQRLQEALNRHPDVKPRTIEWLIKLIDNLYRGKGANDESRWKAGQEALPMVDYLFYYLSGTYGTRDLVAQYAACVVASVEQHRRADVRVVVFQRFLMQTWDIKTLALFMDASRKLSEPARLPCCDFPIDYSSRKGEPTLVDVRKCLWIADKVLFRRGPEAAFTFATALAVKGEPISDQELMQFFVAPGYYGQDIANMRTYELGRAEFRRIQGAIFLEALCNEYVRCEAVMGEALPAIFKKYDGNGDGLLEFEDVVPLMRDMGLEPSTEDEVHKQATLFWAKAAAIEADRSPLVAEPSALHVASSSGCAQEAVPQSPRLHAGGTISAAAVAPAANGGGMAGDTKTDIKLLSVMAFTEACMGSNYVRAWIRLNRTPPPKLRLNNDAEEGNRVLLYILVSRHWKLHGHALTSCFQDTGPLEPQLQQQVTLMSREKDGARKALLLHSVLKLLVGQKLDGILSQLATEQLNQAVKPGFEDSLDRLTHAVRVLYGSRCVLESDLDDTSQYWSDNSYAMQQEQRKMVLGVLGVYNRLRFTMRDTATRFLAHQMDIGHWTKRWRATVQAKRRDVQSVRALKPGDATGSAALDPSGRVSVMDRRIRQTQAAANTSPGEYPASDSPAAGTVTSFAAYVNKPEVKAAKEAAKEAAASAAAAAVAVAAAVAAAAVAAAGPPSGTLQHPGYVGDVGPLLSYGSQGSGSYSGAYSLIGLESQNVNPGYSNNIRLPGPASMSASEAALTTTLPFLPHRRSWGSANGGGGNTTPSPPPGFADMAVMRPPGPSSPLLHAPQVAEGYLTRARSSMPLGTPLSGVAVDKLEQRAMLRRNELASLALSSGLGLAGMQQAAPPSHVDQDLAPQSGGVEGFHALHVAPSGLPNGR